MKDTINADLKAAMKNGDKVRLETVRSINMAVINFEKSKDNAGKSLDINKILRALESQRKMSIEAYVLAGETERADVERSELAVIQEYIDKFLPKQMTESEIKAAMEQIVLNVGGNIGKVMGEFSKTYKGKADMNLASKVLKEVLAK